MIGLVFISAFILFGYVFCFCKWNGKIPTSLSASAYELPVNMRWIWVAVFYTSALLLLPSYLEATSDGTRFLAFIGTFCYALVGATPLTTDERFSYKVHMAGAVLCGVLSQLVIAFNKPLLLWLWLPFLVMGVVNTTEDKTWKTALFWAEMVCFVSTYVYCFIG